MLEVGTYFVCGICRVFCSTFCENKDLRYGSNGPSLTRCYPARGILFRVVLFPGARQLSTLIIKVALLTCSGIMADGVEIESRPAEDVPEGDEPGASRSSMLISDSYEDLASILAEQCTTAERQRLRSGTINEITGEGEDSTSASSRADDASVDSEGGGLPNNVITDNSDTEVDYHI